MPHSPALALDDMLAQAAKKAELARRRPGRYLVSAVQAGVYIGLGEVLLLSVAAPFDLAHSPAVRLLEGAVFGVALILVVLAGAELFTSAAMVMAFGRLGRRTGRRDLARVWGLALLGNLAGAVGLGLLMHATGLLGTAPAGKMLGELIAAKNALTGGELFTRAVLCNLLVCLAVWMVARVRGDGAKMAALWWPVFAFVAAGFEHCVANMALYALAITDGRAGVGDLARNLLYVVPGNVVGGAVLVAGAYWFTRPTEARAGERTRP
ncbi:formate/nitrite transporter family protein [Kitasatospora sp. NBC_00070]|uniref:formate/nitrite transporter family protein n=1 Tax=Kitasatospora sp. NBC_00070 TaxID=2975962 RepID=UPI003251A261